MLGHSTTGKMALGESASLTFYTLSALASAAATLAFIVRPCSVLGVLIKLFDDPRIIKLNGRE